MVLILTTWLADLSGLSEAWRVSDEASLPSSHRVTSAALREKSLSCPGFHSLDRSDFSLEVYLECARPISQNDKLDLTPVILFLILNCLVSLLLITIHLL